MIKMFSKRTKNQKGFTLVELIVVIAILGILGAIAVPRFSDIRASSAVKADATTAAQIINAARIQETETGTKIVEGDPNTTVDDKYMYVPATGQTGSAFAISGGGDVPYEVTFTPDAKFAPYDTEQTVTEHKAFELEED